jgi:hypothetical protein
VSPGKAIREAFAAIAATAANVDWALDHEPGPEGLPQLKGGAGVTLLQRKTDPVIEETGSEQVYREWTVILYVTLRDYTTVQDLLEEVIDALLAAVRAKHDLNGTCAQAWLRDDGMQPEFFHADGVLVKELRLRAEVAEA